MALSDEIERVAAPIAKRMGLYLYEVEVVRSRTPIVRILAQRTQPREPKDGITIAECADLSRETGRTIELEGVIEGAYTLEVSSPGLERKLNTPEHFANALGDWVRIIHVDTEGGSHTLEGTLKAADDSKICIDDADGAASHVVLEKIRKAQTVFRG